MSTNVATRDERESHPAAVESVGSESAAVISMIERASRDPSVDIVKFERLMEMKRQIVADEAERAFNVAMRAAQTEIRPVSANASNPQTRSRYATYDQLDRALRPIYTRHGFSLSFDEADSPKEEHVRVVCYVAHDAGHTRTYRKDMPADGKGAKGNDVMTKTHAAGAAASYGARYLLKGIFNVSIGEDDRDGNEVASPISEQQRDQLRAEIDKVGGGGVRAFCEYFKIESLADLPASQLERGMKAVRRKAPAAPVADERSPF